MKQCAVCGNEYDQCFDVIMHNKTLSFDCFECAIHALAPKCAHCSCKIIGHGAQDKNHMYCSAHCAKQSGADDIKDRQ